MDSRNSKRGWIRIYLTLFFVLTFFVVSAYVLFNQIANARDKESTFEQLRVFSTVLDLVQKYYYEDVDTKKVLYGAIQGMLSSLDPHSAFLKPEEYKELQVETKGQFSGIGIEITIKDGVLTVVAPIEGTPAHRAGLKPNDKILKIDDKSTKDMTLMQAVKLLRGKKGTKVTITVYREGWSKVREITLVRDTIPIRSVKSVMLEDGYGYIKISNFQEQTTSDFQKALKSLESSGLKGLILDLRNNPGGLLDQAVSIADEFIDSGLIVYTDGRLENQRMKFYAKPNEVKRNYPIVVIVNEGSASASEIVAGALQDHKKALILGTNTFGKASVQTIIPLEDGSAIRLTTARYYTPLGRSIHQKGISPDVNVPFKGMEKETTATKKDEKDLFSLEKDAEKATTLEEVSKEKKTQDDNTTSLGLTVENLLKDNQIEESLRILKAYKVFSDIRSN